MCELSSESVQVTNRRGDRAAHEDKRCWCQLRYQGKSWSWLVDSLFQAELASRDDQTKTEAGEKRRTLYQGVPRSRNRLNKRLPCNHVA